MAKMKPPADPKRRAEIIAAIRRDQKDRQKSYREQAMKMYPHICGRCAREFSGKRLRELTVHHRDHDHNNNPADGSNWELLCLYCHDDEHEKYLKKGSFVGGSTRSENASKGLANPFGDLDNLLDHS